MTLSCLKRWGTIHRVFLIVDEIHVHNTRHPRGGLAGGSSRDSSEGALGVADSDRVNRRELEIWG